MGPLIEATPPAIGVHAGNGRRTQVTAGGRGSRVRSALIGSALVGSLAALIGSLAE